MCTINRSKGQREERIVVGEDAKFVRNTWYVAGWCSEFEQGRLAPRTIIDEPIVLFRSGSGTLTAMADRCPHRWAPLSLGRIEGDALRCMYHGLKFSTAGQCVEVPGQTNLPKGLQVKTYAVVERHRWVWIWMGDPQLANPDLIPDAGLLDQPWRRLRTGQIDYNAHHALISDNLLDLSHIAFLHEKSLGRPPEGEPNISPNRLPRSGAEAKPIERGVRTEGWRAGEFNRSVIQAKAAATGDVWSRLDYLVPGIFISYVATYPRGSAAACGGGPPGPELTPLCDTMSCQAVTPMTARTSRYFYSSGPRAADMDEAEAQAVWNIAEEAFREDRTMIEAQQHIIDHHSGQRMCAIPADHGPGIFRAIMQRLIAAEETSARAKEDERVRLAAVEMGGT